MRGPNANGFESQWNLGLKYNMIIPIFEDLLKTF